MNTSTKSTEAHQAVTTIVLPAHPISSKPSRLGIRVLARLLPVLGAAVAHPVALPRLKLFVLIVILITVAAAFAQGAFLLVAFAKWIAVLVFRVEQ